MRSIQAELITAQQSGAADPYINITINSKDYSSRLLSLEHIEEPYRDRATIILSNSDKHFNSVDLRGKVFSIGYGYTTGGSNLYCGDGTSDGTPNLWVKSQSMVSLEGELVCILYAEGGWMKLREYGFITTSDPPHFNVPFTSNQTVYDLITIALSEAGFSINALGDQDDSIIDTFTPIFYANPLQFEPPASIIYRLLQMTLCYLREVESSTFEIVYPQDSDDVDETYYSSQAPYFREYVEKTNLLVPNSIVVFCNREEDGTWDSSNMITGTDSDSDSVSAYGEVIGYYTAPYITNPEDADNRAAAILARLKTETLAGRLVLPFHDCRVELYDRVSIEDMRGN